MKATGSISIIKEKRPGEVRVIATPEGVAAFVQAGFKVLVERGAGLGIGIRDEQYSRAGGTLVSTERAWRSSSLVLKYKPPYGDEFQYLDREKVLCAVFHAEGDRELVNGLLKSRCTAYSYEFFKTPDGVFPLSVASSEIAGKVSVIYGAYHLQRHLGGNGVLIAPIPNVMPAKVLVIGHGNAGGAAARMALAMGADVTVLGTSRERLRAFQATVPTGVHCCVNSPELLKELLPQMDLVIGAILISTYDTPPMIDAAMVKTMKKGSMIIDVTCGYGSGFMPTFSRKTNFDEPIYEKFGVLHCKIDVLPLAYPKSTVDAMSQHLLPYLIELAKAVYDSNYQDPISLGGKIVEDGTIVHPEVLRHFKHFSK